MALPRTSRELARLTARLAFDKKAENIVILDLRKLSAPAEFYVVATATSAPHLEALAYHVRDELKAMSIRTLHVDGSEGGEWTVVDLFDVMVHFFTESRRAFYDLEDLYSDAPAETFDGERPAPRKPLKPRPRPRRK